MFVSKWKLKTRKIMIPSPFLAILQPLVSIKENTAEKKEERKKKNTDGTQTKLNAPHVRCNVKTLSE